MVCVHFTPKSFHPISLHPISFHPTFISPHVHFTPHSFHPTFISPHNHFTPRSFHLIFTSHHIVIIQKRLALITCRRLPPVTAIFTQLMPADRTPYLALCRYSKTVNALTISLKTFSYNICTVYNTCKFGLICCDNI